MKIVNIFQFYILAIYFIIHKKFFIDTYRELYYNIKYGSEKHLKLSDKHFSENF
jgi:hypothetical protein